MKRQRADWAGASAEALKVSHIFSSCPPDTLRVRCSDPQAAGDFRLQVTEPQPGNFKLSWIHTERPGVAILSLQKCWAIVHKDGERSRRIYLSPPHQRLFPNRLSAGPPNTRGAWRRAEGDEWVADASLSVTCVDEDGDQPPAVRRRKSPPAATPPVTSPPPATSVRQSARPADPRPVHRSGEPPRQAAPVPSGRAYAPAGWGAHPPSGRGARVPAGEAAQPSGDQQAVMRRLQSDMRAAQQEHSTVEKLRKELDDARCAASDLQQLKVEVEQLRGRQADIEKLEADLKEERSAREEAAEKLEKANAEQQKQLMQQTDELVTARCELQGAQKEAARDRVARETAERELKLVKAQANQSVAERDGVIADLRAKLAAAEKLGSELRRRLALAHWATPGRMPEAAAKPAQQPKPPTMPKPPQKPAAAPAPARAPAAPPTRQADEWFSSFRRRAVARAARCAAFQSLRSSGIDGLSDDHTQVLTECMRDMTRAEAHAVVGAAEGQDAQRKAKELLAKMHPDKCTDPAKKQAQMRKFQLVGHARNILSTT